MTVGETLAEARYRAGFTVEELSELTRIRGSVIRSIEQDDYAACGGDLYVRGYVRAIAGAIGLDAQPLIRQYDATKAQAQRPADTSAAGPATTSFDLPPVPSSVADTRLDLPPVHQEPDATTFDLPAVHADPEATSLDLAAGQGGPEATSLDLSAGQGGPEATSLDLPAAQDGPAATSLDLPAVQAGADATSLDLPAVQAGPDAPARDWERADPAATGFPEAFFSRPLEGGFGSDGFSEPAEGTRGSDDFGFGYIDEPAVSMPATPADRAAPPAGAGQLAGMPVFPTAAPGSQPPPAPGYGEPWPPPPTRVSQAGAVRKARAKRWPWVAGIAAVAALVIAGAVGILANGGKSAGTPSANARAATQQGVTSGGPAQSASAPPTASKSAPSAPLTTLGVTSARAFGPNGLADGDNPNLAGNAISHGSAGWTTQWYATPDFGRLKNGTGLLLDLGHQESVSSVRLYLTHFSGVNVQLRAATTRPAGPQGLPVVATAGNASGTVRLTLRHPATARYLLVWFTLLPPDGQGHFQETVYRVVVTGRH